MQRRIILALFICLAGFVHTPQPASAASSDASSPLPIDELRQLAEIFGKIKAGYVENVSDKQLLKDAIEGMLGGLDPHSTFLDVESYKDIRIGTEGKFGGLGIEVTQENGFIKVVAPIDDTPAKAAGVKSGDLITRIDGSPIKDLSLSDAVKMMRGEPGSSIRLTIIRDGREKPLDIVIKRAIIKIASVKSRVLDDQGYGYLRITQFQSTTAELLKSHIETIKKKLGGTIKGLVLDLRNNPGGVLSGAVAVSDAFLSKGEIVSTRGRSEGSALSFSATPNDDLSGAPMVVLVNGGSASASEIVAGALQDHNRAIIMGTKTFGKGSVQTILPMDDGSALKITTARYYTPDDRSIQETGIIPDVIVEDLKLSKKQPNTNGKPLREEDLAGHLENTKRSTKKTKPDATEDATERDYQLQEALNLLKGLNIVNSKTNGSS